MNNLMLRTGNYYCGQEILLQYSKLTDKVILFVLHLHINGHTVVVQEELTCPIEMSETLVDTLSDKVYAEVERLGL